MKGIFENLYISKNEPYLRPYISKGNPHNAKICFVGTNPATPIYPKDIKLDEYIELLNDYDKFMQFYKQIRIKSGKTTISRTRLGIMSFRDWVEKELHTNMIETDIFTYPTKNIKDLVKVNNDILDRSLNLFWNVLTEFKTPIIILHGSMTVETFNRAVKGKKIRYNSNNTKIEEIEKLNPYAEIDINGTKSILLASKHFMYYGKTGKVFEDLKKNLRDSINHLNDMQIFI